MLRTLDTLEPWAELFGIGFVCLAIGPALIWSIAKIAERQKNAIDEIAYGDVPHLPWGVRPSGKAERGEGITAQGPVARTHYKASRTEAEGAK